MSICVSILLVKENNTLTFSCFFLYLNFQYCVGITNFSVNNYAFLICPTL